MGAINLTPTKNVSMTTAQRDSIVSPEAGWTIYNNTVGQLEEYDGTNWVGRKDLKFTDLGDTVSSLGSGNSLVVIDSTGNLIRTNSIERVMSASTYSSKTFKHAHHLGANWYWPCGETNGTFISMLDELDITSSDGYSPVTNYTSTNTILTEETAYCNSTTIGSRSDTMLNIGGPFVDGNESFSLALTITVPLSELAADLTDRTVFFFGSSGEIVIRNGQVAYKLTGYHYHSETITADQPIDIVITREGSSGLMTLSVNGVVEDIVEHTNVTSLQYCNFFSNGFGQYLEGKIEGIAIWKRVLTSLEIKDHHRVRRNLPLSAAYDTVLNFSDLTDGFDYSLSDADKVLSINSTGDGLNLQSVIPADQLIEDGLRGYLAGSVPAASIVAMMILNKNLTLPVNAPKSNVYALTAPVNPITFNIIKRALGSYETDIVIGSVIFAGNSATGSVSIPTQTTFIPGDMLCLESPALVEGSRDIFINIVGYGTIPFYT